MALTANVYPNTLVLSTSSVKINTSKFNLMRYAINIEDTTHIKSMRNIIHLGAMANFFDILFQFKTHSYSAANLTKLTGILFCKIV